LGLTVALPDRRSRRSTGHAARRSRRGARAGRRRGGHPRLGPHESVVASVNDDVITNYDILQRMRLLVVTAGIQPTRNDCRSYSAT